MTQADSVLSTPPINTPAEPPKPSQKTLAARLAKQGKERERALNRLRKPRVRARAEIDRLLEFLDASDIDPDLEPSLGWPISGRSFDHEVADLEAEPEHDEVCGDGEPDLCDEPSLGSVTNYAHSDQEQWAAGGRRDLELDGAESGIGDFDGLHEQVGTQDWQQGSMG
jgi:hypothetical protein